MKKYKKKPDKLFQVRLALKEHKEVTEFINKFGVTHREFMLAVVNELREATVVRENKFWTSNTQFAYHNSDRYDKQLTPDSVCEECGAGHPPHSERGMKQLERHHYLGYEGEGAFKVQILCRPCHWKKPKNYKKKNV